MPSIPSKQPLSDFLAAKGFWVIYPRYRGAWESGGEFLAKSPHEDILDVLDELLGLGPIEPLLKDPTITDILVNGAERVFVERYGVLEPTPVRFVDRVKMHAAAVHVPALLCRAAGGASAGSKAVENR